MSKVSNGSKVRTIYLGERGQTENERERERDDLMCFVLSLLNSGVVLYWYWKKKGEPHSILFFTSSFVVFLFITDRRTSLKVLSYAMSKKCGH